MSLADEMAVKQIMDVHVQSITYSPAVQWAAVMIQLLEMMMAPQ